MRIQYLFILLLSCLLMSSCASKTFDTSNIKQHTYKNIQCTVWYHVDDMTLPLLASLEWKNHHDVNPQLGLILLQGKRFAHCISQENSMQCTLDDAMPALSMQKIANYAAQCIMNSCFIYEKNTSEKNMQGWICDSIDETSYTFTKPSTEITIKVKIEEVITWP